MGEVDIPCSSTQKFFLLLCSANAYLKQPYLSIGETLLCYLCTQKTVVVLRPQGGPMELLLSFPVYLGFNTFLPFTLGLNTRTPLLV